MAKMSILQDINGELGYSTNLNLSVEELGMLRKMIREQWLYRLQVLEPTLVSEFDRLGIRNYHKLSDKVDHASVWPKTSRVLSRESVEVIRSMNFFKTLEKEVGPFLISDEEHLGWENIYWRLVRPGNSDVGSLHADKWFWDICSYGRVADFEHERLKIWIAIDTVPGKNGFLILPGSHLKTDWRWHSEERFGLNKPVFDDVVDKGKLKLLPLASGNTVVFHDAMIHGGADNLADTTRVSLEFTLLVPVKERERIKLVESSCES